MISASTRPETQSRLLARIVRDLLRTETFETLADLTDALKFRCAALKIPWTNDDIGAAYGLIETNTPLLPRPAPTRRLQRDERDDGPSPITHDEALAFLATIMAKVG